MESVKTDEERLQMFFDGELDPEEEAALRRDLERSPEKVAELEELERLRSAMQEGARRWSGTLDSEALFARIEADLREEQELSRPTAESFAPRLRVFRGGAGRRVWGGLAAGLAAAAAALIVIAIWPDPIEPAQPSIAEVRGSEVVEVDFGPNTGTVFEVEGRAGEPVAVIWISDEEVGRR